MDKTKLKKSRKIYPTYAPGEIQGLLDDLNLKYKVSDKTNWDFQCPQWEEHEHGDTNFSASIDMETGAWKCFSCNIGGGVNHLRDGVALQAEKAYDPSPSIEESFVYTDAEGNPLWRKKRYLNDGKMMQTSEPWRDGGFRSGEGLGNLVSPLYNLPAVLDAIANDETIYLVEGEKDVRWMTERGYTATTAPYGRSEGWKDHYTYTLRGARVVIISDDDRDQKGYTDHALPVAQKLSGITKSIEILFPAVGKDAADHFHNGYGIGDFKPFSNLQPSTSLGSLIVEGRKAVVRWASEIKAQPLEWLWEGWIPKKCLTVLAGDGGVGKSTLLVGLAKRLSFGDGVNDGKPGNTLILSTEDDIESIIIPRLEAAGADRSRVGFIHIENEDYNESLVFPRDIHLLGGVIEEQKIDLIILDPGNAHVDIENGYSNIDVVKVMGILAGISQKYNCSIIYLLHLNKETHGSFKQRIIGSVGHTNSARAVLGLGENPETVDTGTNQVILAHVKHNLVAKQKSLVFEVVNKPTLVDDCPEPFDVAILVKIGESDLTADDLVAPKEKGTPKLDEARAFIELQLAVEGGSMLTKEFNEAAKDRGISAGTLSKAKEALNVVTEKIDGINWTRYG